MSKEQNSYSEKCFSEEVIDENCFVGIHFKDGNFDNIGGDYINYTQFPKRLEIHK